jgi:glutathione S-transferase
MCPERNEFSQPVRAGILFLVLENRHSFTYCSRMLLYCAKFPHSSLPVQIVLEEIGSSYESILVDLEEDPPLDLLTFNPVGGVPVLVLENGKGLTEIAAILQYLADQNPRSKLAPEWENLERYRLQEWLSFVGTELHKGFWPMGLVGQLTHFPDANETLNQLIRKNLNFKLDVTAKKLGARDFILESGFSVGDPYLYTILTWANQINLDLSQWPTLVQYLERISKRPATIRALQKIQDLAL